MESASRGLTRTKMQLSAHSYSPFELDRRADDEVEAEVVEVEVEVVPLIFALSLGFAPAGGFLVLGALLCGAPQHAT